MKKHILKAVFGLATIAILGSCGSDAGEEKEISVTPKTTEISGELAGNLEVVKGDYKLITGYTPKLSVKIKAIKAMTSEELEGKEFDLNINVVDENGIIVSDVELSSAYDERSKILSLLKKGSGEIIVTFEGYSQVLDNVKTFECSSSAIKQSGSTEGESDKETTASNGSEDFDKILDDYESYTDQYIKVLKKMKNGDNSVAEEVNDLLEKTQELSKSLENANKNEELSVEQAQRMLKIQAKIAKSAM